MTSYDRPPFPNVTDWMSTYSENLHLQTYKRDMISSQIFASYAFLTVHIGLLNLCACWTYAALFQFVILIRFLSIQFRTYSAPIPILSLQEENWFYALIPTFHVRTLPLFQLCCKRILSGTDIKHCAAFLIAAHSCNITSSLPSSTIHAPLYLFVFRFLFWSWSRTGRFHRFLQCTLCTVVRVFNVGHM